MQRAHNHPFGPPQFYNTELTTLLDQSEEMVWEYAYTALRQYIQVCSE